MKAFSALKDAEMHYEIIFSIKGCWNAIMKAFSALKAADSMDTLVEE